MIERESSDHDLGGLKQFLLRARGQFIRIAGRAIERGFNDFLAKIARFALRLEQLDGDIVEGSRVGQYRMGEASAGIADLAVGQRGVSFGFARDGIDEIGRAKRDGDIGQLMRMKKRGVARGKAEAEHADVGIFEQQMMMRLVLHQDRLSGIGSLRPECGAEKNDGREAGDLDRRRIF